MLTPEQIDAAYRVVWTTVPHRNRLSAFAHHIAAEARRDALEEAAQLIEKSTYRKRWAKAAVNSQASNVPPCELAAAIRKLKEDTQ